MIRRLLGTIMIGLVLGMTALKLGERPEPVCPLPGSVLEELHTPCVNP